MPLHTTLLKEIGSVIRTAPTSLGWRRSPTTPATEKQRTGGEARKQSTALNITYENARKIVRVVLLKREMAILF